MENNLTSREVEIERNRAFRSELRSMMQRHEINVSDLAAAVGVSHSVATRWFDRLRSYSGTGTFVRPLIKPEHEHKLRQLFDAPTPVVRLQVARGRAAHALAAASFAADRWLAVSRDSEEMGLRDLRNAGTVIDLLRQAQEQIAEPGSA